MVIDFGMYKLDGWKYIEAQADADNLLIQAHGFHDTVLRELNYVSGSYVDKNMYPTDSERRVTLRFDSQWCSTVELIFEGVKAMNLRPSPDNYSSDIFGASVILQNEVIFFCDDVVDEVDKTHDDWTWIEAYELRWRFID